MPHSARKTELRHALSERLVEKGVLPKSAAAEAGSETEVEAPMVDAKAVEVVTVKKFTQKDLVQIMLKSLNNNILFYNNITCVLVPVLET